MMRRAGLSRTTNCSCSVALDRACQVTEAGALPRSLRPAGQKSRVCSKAPPSGSSAVPRRWLQLCLVQDTWPSGWLGGAHSEHSSCTPHARAGVIEHGTVCVRRQGAAPASWRLRHGPTSDSLARALWKPTHPGRCRLRGEGASSLARPLPSIDQIRTGPFAEPERAARGSGACREVTDSDIAVLRGVEDVRDAGT